MGIFAFPAGFISLAQYPREQATCFQQLSGLSRAQISLMRSCQARVLGRCCCPHTCRSAADSLVFLFLIKCPVGKLMLKPLRLGLSN